MPIVVRNADAEVENGDIALCMICDHCGQEIIQGGTFELLSDKAGKPLDGRFFLLHGRCSEAYLHIGRLATDRLAPSSHGAKAR